MKKHTFKVGDKVRVREWEDMVNEYGFTGSGQINTPGAVLSKYADKDLCGKEVVINKFVCDNSVAVEGHIFWLPTAALEPIEEEIKEGDWVQVKSWDELVEEFGPTCGPLKVDGIYFPEDMGEEVCGKTFQVKESDYKSFEAKGWHVPFAAVRKVDPPEEKEAIGDAFTREVPRLIVNGIDENGNHIIEEIGNTTIDLSYTAKELSGTLTKPQSSIFNSLSTFAMDTYTKARLALKKEPIKSFIKHGILDENEQLTNQGREVFIEWLLYKHQDEFYKEVVQKMEDKKK